MQVLILLGLIVLNGLFAMAEIALVTARKARLQKYLDEGDRAAAAALALGEHPTRFLSTIQIGITSIGVLNGVFGEAALAQPMAQWLQAHPVEHDAPGTQRAVLSLAPGCQPLAQVLAKEAGPVVLLSGPEGGLSPAEEALALQAGFAPVTLGPRILRAETAPIALLGALAATGV